MIEVKETQQLHFRSSCSTPKFIQNFNLTLRHCCACEQRNYAHVNKKCRFF